MLTRYCGDKQNSTTYFTVKTSKTKVLCSLNAPPGEIPGHLVVIPTCSLGVSPSALSEESSSDNGHCVFTTVLAHLPTEHEATLTWSDPAADKNGSVYCPTFQQRTYIAFVIRETSNLKIRWGTTGFFRESVFWGDRRQAFPAQGTVRHRPLAPRGPSQVFPGWSLTSTLSFSYKKAGNECDIIAGTSLSLC